MVIQTCERIPRFLGIDLPPGRRRSRRQPRYNRGHQIRKGLLRSDAFSSGSQPEVILFAGNWRKFRSYEAPRNERSNGGLNVWTRRQIRCSCSAYWTPIPITAPTSLVSPALGSMDGLDSRAGGHRGCCHGDSRKRQASGGNKASTSSGEAGCDLDRSTRDQR